MQLRNLIKFHNTLRVDFQNQAKSEDEVIRKNSEILALSLRKKPVTGGEKNPGFRPGLKKLEIV
jgi:hypothetical protein